MGKRIKRDNELVPVDNSANELFDSLSVNWEQNLLLSDVPSFFTTASLPFKNMRKKEFRIFDKITLFGKEGETFITKPKKEKFKDFKESISEADFKKVDHIEIEMLKNMVSDLDIDDIEFVAKIIKRICKKYNGLVKYKTI